MQIIQFKQQKYNARTNTKKHDISEFINLSSSKTKKQEKLYHNTTNNKTGYIRQNQTRGQIGGSNNYTTREKLFGKTYTDIPPEFYFVKSKKEYIQRARDVRASWIRIAIQRKLGRMREQEYLMFKALLRANLHFARFNLYFEKLNQLTIILNHGNTSLIQDCRHSMDLIFSYQNEISLKIGKKGFNPKDIEKIFKKQDKEKNKLFDAFIFKNDSDIRKGCTNLLGFSKNKKIICILNKYRKVEAKFNKYFEKFRNEIKAFFIAYQGCPGGISKSVQLQLLDISGFEEQKETFIEDQTCESFKANEAKDKILSKALSDDSVIDSMIKEKQESISTKFKEQMNSLNDMMKAFNKKIIEINQRFSIMENYGLHRYSGMKPPKKKLFQTILGDKAYQIINPKRLAKLATNPDFIKQFENIIKQIAEKGRDLVIPVETSISVLIPIIYLNSSKLATTEITFFSMNMEGFKAGKTLNDLYNLNEPIIDTTKPGNAQVPPTSIYNLPAIVCIQNGTQEMTNKTGAFAIGFLQGKYTPISFSSHRKDKYNIIYIRTDVISIDPAKPEYIKNLQPVNQSGRFVLNEFPAGMTWENNGYSYTVANFIFDNSTSQNKTSQGISVVCTELVGSRADDMFFANKVRDFSYVALDGKPAKGLRGAQITSIIKIVKSYNGTEPDFIVGDMGGMYSSSLQSSSQSLSSIKKLGDAIGSSGITYQDAAWELFKKRHPDLVQYFLEDPISGKGNINSYLEFNDALANYKPYTIEPLTSGDTITKLTPPLLSSYIFSKAAPANSISTRTHIQELIKEINNLGGNIPISLKFNVSNNLSNLSGTLHGYASKSIDTSTKNVETKIKLFSEEELQTIIRVIDNLMGNFAFSRTSYLRRDLGCLNLRDNGMFSNRELPKLYDKKSFGTGKSLIKKPINKIKFKNLDQVINYPENESAINQLKDLYCQELPSIIDTYLFQASGKFSSATKPGEFYSVNQITSSAGKNYEFKSPLKIIIDAMNPRNPPEEQLLTPDIAIRLFIMPRRHLKLVMGIDFDKHGASNLRKLTNLALKNFYSTYATNRLEGRLSEILLPKTAQPTNSASLSAQPSYNILAHLLEKNPDGHLSNINDGNAVLDLFEIIFIFLRLKFIEQQVQLYNIKTKEEQRQQTELETKVIHSIQEKTISSNLFDTITKILSDSTDSHPLNKILYNVKIIRKDPQNGNYLIPAPTIVKDPLSFFGVIASGYSKDKAILPKPIAELAKQKLLGLQYMESFLSNELGARLDIIANILEHQILTPESQTSFKNKTNLAEGVSGIAPTDYELANLETNIQRIYQETQVAEPKEVAMANDIFARCRTLLLNINIISDVWQQYFVNVIRVLEHYNQFIYFLVIFENNDENPPLLTKVNILNKLNSIYNDTKRAIEQIVKLPFELSRDIVLIYQQMGQIKAHIINPSTFKKDNLQVSFLNPRELPKDKSFSAIQPQYEPTIDDIQLRTAYLIFNSIISLAYPKEQSTPTTQSTPITLINLEPTKYTELVSLCDLLEIGYYNFNRRHHYTQKGGYQSSNIQTEDIQIGGNGNIEFLRKNFEVLVNISRYISIATDILTKGDTSYDSVSNATSNPEIKLSALLEMIVSSVSDFSNMVARNPKNKELCGFIIRPLGLLVDFAYHITNVFTNNSSKSFSEDQLITETKSDSSLNSSLNALYQQIKYLLCKGNELNAVNTARSNVDITMITRNIPGTLGNLTNTIDYGLVGKTTMEAVKGLKIYEEYVIHNEIMQLQSDTIQDLSSSPSVEVNYNQFKMDNLKNMEELDVRISEQIRNLQANDYCNNANNASKLEYQTTYKPSIFKLDVGTFKAGKLYDNIMEKTDNSMLYLFLDVIDYSKNNPKGFNDIYKFVHTNIDKLLEKFMGSGSSKSSNEPFSSFYEKTRITNNHGKYECGIKHQNFNDNLQKKLFTEIDNNIDVNIDVNIAEYIFKGSKDGWELTNDFIDSSYNNFLFLLYNLLYLKRFTITKTKNVNSDLPDEGFISIIYGESKTLKDETRLTDGKKFCINYFNGLEIDFYENMFIDLKFLRRYFLKVIYENPKLVDKNDCLDKTARIKLILISIFALSYLLNYNPSDLKPDVEIQEFAYILLGISTLKNYTPALYFKIGAIMNNPATANFQWTDKFIAYFLKDKVSYYLPKIEADTASINNDTVLEYLKSLCVCKANLFAKDIYNDASNANNCMKVMGFINTARMSKKPEINNLLEFIYLTRRLEVLIGTSEKKGLLHDYLQKYNLDLNAASDKGLPHLFCIIDYLEAIQFYNIITKINDIYKILNIPNFTITDIVNLIKICNNSYNQKITELFKHLQLISNIVQQNREIIPKLTEKCFNLDLNLNEFSLDTSNPLNYFKQLMDNIMDCIVFALKYYIPSPDEITDFANNKYQDKMGNIFNMILDIFKNELNTLLQPYFSLKLEKEANDDETRITMNKSMIDLIKINLEELATASTTGNLPDYSYNKIPPQKSSDLEIFDFINRLITCHDGKGNYYAIGDTNILESYLTKPEIKTFISSITSNGYLFNNLQVSLNTKYFADIFTQNDKLQHKNYKTNADAPDNKRCPYFRGTADEEHIYTHNKKAKFEYYNYKIFNKMKDLFINYFTYFDFYSDKTNSIPDYFYHNNTKTIDLFIQNVINEGAKDINATKQTNKKSIKIDYNTTVDNEINGNYDYGKNHWSNITKAINGGNNGALEIKSIIYNQDNIHKFIQEYFVDILIIKKTIENYGNKFEFTDSDIINLAETNLQKLIQEINNLYFDNDINDYNKTQTKISEINTIFNLVMESLDNKIKILKQKQDKFKNPDYKTKIMKFYKNTPNFGTYEVINYTEINKPIIDNLLLREYWNIEEFLDGIRECLLDLISLVPMPLNSKYINPALTHRNNLFLATSALGYMNMRNIEYSLRYNVYTDVKLGCYNLLKNKYKSEYFGIDKDANKNLEFYAKGYKLLEKYFREINILDNVNKNLVKNTNDELKIITNKKLQDFLHLRINTSNKEDIAKAKYNKEFQWSRIYTHPYFNYNSNRQLGTDAITDFGTGGTLIDNSKLTNFSKIFANELTKHTILHFIKYNYNKTISQDNYCKIIKHIVDSIKEHKSSKSLDIKPFYAKWKKSKNYIISARSNVSNMKNAIAQLFNNWYNMLKSFNDNNKKLLLEITDIKFNNSGNDEYLELKDNNIDLKTFKSLYAPKLLELFNNTINIERVREYADKFLRDCLFMYLLYYNLVNEAQYNIIANKYYKAKTSQSNTSGFINFVYCYLNALEQNKDIDKTTEIAKSIISSQENKIDINKTIKTFFDNYENNKKSIKDFTVNTPNNYDEQRHCLNPNFYKIVSKFIGHILTKYIKYDHTNLIGADNNIFYGSDIFVLADRILSLEGKSFSTSKESLLLELYKTLNLPTQLQEFTYKYKEIFNKSNTIVLKGGNPINSVRKTRKYKSIITSKTDKLTMIIRKYNEKTKTNLFQARKHCNCSGTKHRNTKKFNNL